MTEAFEAKKSKTKVKQKREKEVRVNFLVALKRVLSAIHGAPVCVCR